MGDGSLSVLACVRGTSKDSSLRPVAALFCRADSVYRTLALVDVFDARRDALTWGGGCSVVAHPPCRAWGRLRAFAHPLIGERDLARFAVAMVRRWGGVLEHPAGSLLWRDQCLPLGRQSDAWGGFTMPVNQCWFGHRAAKSTWLYIVGTARPDVPRFVVSLDPPSHCVETRKRGGLPSVSKAEREATPLEFARWLVDLARRCEVNHG